MPVLDDNSNKELLWASRDANLGLTRCAFTMPITNCDDPTQVYNNEEEEEERA